MIYREFQGLKLSGLGLGMMRLPTADGKDNQIDEALTATMIDFAYKSGVNYFDTAWGYHGGNSELMVGKYLTKYPRESYYLATKFPGYDNSNMPKVREIFERQMEKCQTDYFDFYLFHNVYEGNIDDYLDPKFGILDYLLEQKRKGRIRHLGFSCHGSVPVLKRFLEAYGDHMEFCQLQLNYMDWHFQEGEEKVKLLSQRNIPVWVMEPLRGGKLTMPSDAMTTLMRKFRPKETAPGWAFRFLQTIPGVTMVLSGMSNMEQLEQNIQTWETDAPLLEEEMAALAAQADRESALTGVPCTACRYCVSHCPQELPIPELLAFYNEHKFSGGGFIPTMGVAALPIEKRPSACLGCRSCEQVCPQQIRISEVMDEFSQLLQM